MNILPKKSWHVRTKANIERVRKDEAQAAEEEKERHRKIALAESEARTDLLRDKARANRDRHQYATSKMKKGDKEVAHKVDPFDTKNSQTSIVNKDGHVNFFQDIEDGLNVTGTNVEHEKEKLAEQEKRERSIGLLTYLGQSAAETQTVKPWYQMAPQHRKEQSETEEKSSRAKDGKNSRKECDVKRKRRLDPMVKMNEYVAKKKKLDDKDDGKHRPNAASRPDPADVAPANSIERLRAERLRREQAERQRAQQLMAKLRGETVDRQEAPLDDRQRGYNSQFNPDLARRPRWKQNHR